MDILYIKSHIEARGIHNRFAFSHLPVLCQTTLLSRELFYDLGLHKPPSFLKPQIPFVSLDHAGIAIPNSTHITGAAAYVHDLVDLINPAFVKDDLQRAQPPLRAEPHIHRNISFLTLSQSAPSPLSVPCYPALKKPTGCTAWSSFGLMFPS